MKILMVLTSHDTLGTTGKKTGFWLEEFATPYYVFKDAGATITLASPKGGQPPLDPKSDEPDFQTAATARYKADAVGQAALANTLKLATISAGDYDAVFYPGGHGPLWDLAEDKYSITLIETMYAQGKPVAAVCHAPGIFRHTKAANGLPLVQGKSVTGFSNSEEIAAGLIDVVPFRVEDELRRNGALYTKGPDWQSYVVSDGGIFTGQNPASSEAVAKTMLAQGSLTAGSRKMEGFMTSKDEYVRKLQAKMDEWSVEIDKLTAKAGEVSADVKAEFHEQIALLQTKQATARQKIEELQHAGEGAWTDLKSGIELAWIAVGEAIDSARNRFK